MSEQTRVVLAKRPKGAPSPDNFRVERAALTPPGANQLLLKTLYLSVDPYMRGRMSEGPSYAPPVALGEVMVGGAVSRVEQSNNPGFKVGDLVVGDTGWQSHSLSDGSGLQVLDAAIGHPSLALSVLGMPGFTAYHGLLNIGQPKAGETLVVASAAGTVGAVVGQLARLKGARAVGVAGGAEKCRFAREELGFDLCLDHYAEDFAEQLAAATPKGIDIYYENVGGKVFAAVLPRLNIWARVPVCGLIAHYNDGVDLPAGPDHLPQLMNTILFRRLLLQGFIIGDHWATGHAAFLRDMSAWVAEGRIKIREDIVDGLEQAPQALVDLLAGKHFGKVVVRVSSEEESA